MVISFLTIELVAGPRSTKAHLRYDGELPYPDVERAHRTLFIASGRTEADAVAKARAWIAKRSIAKILQMCERCRDGQALEQTAVRDQAYRYQVHCGACGVVLFRGDPPAPGRGRPTSKV